MLLILQKGLDLVPRQINRAANTASNRSQPKITLEISTKSQNPISFPLNIVNLIHNASMTSDGIEPRLDSVNRDRQQD